VPMKIYPEVKAPAVRMVQEQQFPGRPPPSTSAGRSHLADRLGRLAEKGHAGIVCKRSGWGLEQPGLVLPRCCRP
jgi:hypothetical protein